MALTITPRTLRRNWNIVTGGKKVRVTTVTFGADYPTGGYPLTAAQLGLSTIDFVQAVQDANAATTAYVFIYDYTNSKLQAFRSGAINVAQAEAAANEAALNGVVVRVLAHGAG